MRGTSPRSVQEFFDRSGCPFTIVLIAINVIVFFVVAGVSHGANPFEWLVFWAPEWPRHFWTAVTWPLYGGGHPINVLFGCMWAFWVCGSLERSWGLRTFAVFFAIVSAIMAVSLWIGNQMLRPEMGVAPLAGLWMGIAAPTVAWCAINSRETICLWGFIRIPAPLLSALTCVVVWYEMGGGAIGLFPLAACAAAYWYATSGRITFRGYAPVSRFGRPGGSNRPHLRMETFDRESVSSGPRWSPLHVYRAWQEKRKLEQLWKRSFKDQDKRD
jgi:hypothetical protein